MSYRIICIGRQFGSGGHEIAVRAGAELGIRVYEKEILKIACEYGDVAREVLEDADERATNPLLYAVVREGNYRVMRGQPTSEVLFALQTHVIRRIANHEDCIFVGRCADYILAGRDVRMCRVFISADEETRVERKRRQEDLSRARAERLVRKMDKQRRTYYEHYTGQIWGDPRFYDLCIDASRVGMDEAVREIAELYHTL